MKALEILKNINVWGDVTEVQEQIYEAIAELEALENKSCDSCKINNVCNIYKIIGSNVGLIVSCNTWESK